MDAREAAWWFLFAAHHLAGSGRLPAHRSDVLRISRVPTPPFTPERIARALVERQFLTDSAGVVDLTLDGHALCDAVLALNDRQRQEFKALVSLRGLAIRSAIAKDIEIWGPLVTSGMAEKVGNGGLRATEDGRAVLQVLAALSSQPFVGEVEVPRQTDEGEDPLIDRLRAEISLESRVAVLLGELLDQYELSRILGSMQGRQFLHELPGGGVPFAQYIHAAVAALQRRGQLDALLEAVKMHRPGRAPAVEFVRSRGEDR